MHRSQNLARLVAVVALAVVGLAPAATPALATSSTAPVVAALAGAPAATAAPAPPATAATPATATAVTDGATTPAAAGERTGGAGGGRLVGTLDVLHADPLERTPGDATAETVAVLDAAGGPVVLDPAEVPPEARRGDTLALEPETGDVELVAPARTSRVATGTTKVLLVLTSWTGNPVGSATQAQGTTALAGVDGWYEEVSDGRKGIAGTSYGWIQIAKPSGSCAGSDSISFAYNLRSSANAALTTAGVSLSSYDTIVYHFPETAPEAKCPWAGLGGSSIWLAGNLSEGVITHELGHTFGLGHANTLTCTDGATTVTISGTCSTVEYGDPTDTMGNSDAGFAGPHLGLLGWLGAAEQLVLPQPSSGADTSSTTTLVPLETPRSGHRVIRIDRADGSSLYLENRQRIGVDATEIGAGEEGVRLHFRPSPEARIPCAGTVTGFSCVGSSYILRPQPAVAGSARTWRVLPANGWSHPDGTLRISLTAASATTFSVTVEQSPPTPGTAPVLQEAIPEGDGYRLRWTAGTGSQGGAPTGYALQFVPEGSDFDSPFTAVFDSTGLTVDLTGIGPFSGSTRYRIRVAALNDMGTGVFSAPTRPLIPGGHSPLPSWDGFVARQLTDFTGSPGSASTRAIYASQLDAGTTTPAGFIEAQMDDRWFAPLAPVARLYWAYFGRIPDQTGLQYWAGRRRAGVSLNTVSQSFARSAEFARTYGALTDAEFVELVYRNVLGRSPDAAGLAFWTEQLAQGRRNRGQVMNGFSESAEYRTKMATRVTAVLAYSGMLRRSPSVAELAAALPLTTRQLLERIRVSVEYDTRVS